jgi:hypothetical protein
MVFFATIYLSFIYIQLTEQKQHNDISQLKRNIKNQEADYK